MMMMREGHYSRALSTGLRNMDGITVSRKSQGPKPGPSPSLRPLGVCAAEGAPPGRRPCAPRPRLGRVPRPWPRGRGGGGVVAAAPGEDEGGGMFGPNPEGRPVQLRGYCARGHSTSRGPACSLTLAPPAPRLESAWHGERGLGVPNLPRFGRDSVCVCVNTVCLCGQCVCVCVCIDLPTLAESATYS